MAHCFMCKLNLMVDDFSGAQMRKPTNRRKCKRCIDGLPPRVQQSTAETSTASTALPVAEPDVQDGDDESELAAECAWSRAAARAK